MGLCEALDDLRGFQGHLSGVLKILEGVSMRSQMF